MIAPMRLLENPGRSVDAKEISVVGSHRTVASTPQQSLSDFVRKTACPWLETLENKIRIQLPWEDSTKFVRLSPFLAA
jgi:hypothetical protein